MYTAQERMLKTVRQVLTGEVRRADLVALKSRQEHAYIAVALLLARKEEYLDEKGGRLWVKGKSYSAILSKLLFAGVTEALYSEAERTVAASKSARLHYSSQGPDRTRQQVYITPPAELVALVEELRDHLAVKRFLERFNLPLSKKQPKYLGRPIE